MICSITEAMDLRAGIADAGTNRVAWRLLALSESDRAGRVLEGQHLP
jgi:hypothetical protein